MLFSIAMEKFLQDILLLLQNLSRSQAFLLFLIENLLIFFLALFFSALLQKKFSRWRVSPLPDPLTRKEILLASACIFLNTVVTLAGYLLWKAGWIRLST